MRMLEYTGENGSMMIFFVNDFSKDLGKWSGKSFFCQVCLQVLQVDEWIMADWNNFSGCFQYVDHIDELIIWDCL